MCDTCAETKLTCDNGDRFNYQRVIQSIMDEFYERHGKGEEFVWGDDDRKISSEITENYFVPAIGGALNAGFTLLYALQCLRDGSPSTCELICPRTGEKYRANFNLENLDAISAYSKTLFANMDPQALQEHFDKCVKCDNTKPVLDPRFVKSESLSDPRSAALSTFRGLFERI
jgi:hypothetical protein